MTRPLFKYCLLKYIHSDLLGEALNIGILFIFEETSQIRFRYPTNFTRIRNAYGRSFPQSVVNGILKGITKEVAQIGHAGQIPIELQDSQTFDLLLNRLLVKDATVLRFDDFHSAVQYSSEEHIVEDYYSLFFSHYDENEHTKPKLDDDFISRSIKKLLFQRDSDYRKLIKNDVVVAAPKLPEGNFMFDFSWKNDLYHYVKPIAFDFQDTKTINQKAATYYGYLSAVSETVTNSSIDILTTRPQDKRLWQTYDKAIEMIDSVRLNKKIIEQRNFPEYADEVISHGEKLL